MLIFSNKKLIDILKKIVIKLTHTAWSGMPAMNTRASMPDQAPRLQKLHCELSVKENMYDHND